MRGIDYQSESQFPNPSATTARVLFWIMIGTLIWSAVSLMLAAMQKTTPAVQNGLLAFIMYGGVVTGCLCFGMLLGYFAMRSDAARTERVRQAILTRQYLVRWRYANDTWREFRKFTLPKEDKRRRGAIITVTVFIGLALLVGMIVGYVQPGNDPMGIEIVLSICVITAVLCTLGLVLYLFSDNRRRERMMTPQDSYVSTLGAYVNGKWVLWGTAQQRLSDLLIDEGSDGGPACMEFVIDCGENTRKERMLIPADQIDLARRVADAVKNSAEAKRGGGMNDVVSILRGLTEMFR